MADSAAWLAQFLHARLRDESKLEKVGVYIRAVFESPVLLETEKLYKVVQTLQNLCKPDELGDDVNALAREIFDTFHASLAVVAPAPAAPIAAPEVHGAATTQAVAATSILSWQPPNAPSPVPRQPQQQLQQGQRSNNNPNYVPPWLRNRVPKSAQGPQSPPSVDFYNPEPGQIVEIRQPEEIPGWAVCPFDSNHTMPLSTMLKHLVTGHIHLMKKWTFRQTYLEATGGPRPEQEQRSPPPPQASQSPSPFVESDQLYAQQTHLQVAPIQYEAPPKPSFAKFSDDDDDNDEQYEAAPLPSDITHERTVEISDLVTKLAQGIDQVKEALYNYVHYGTKSERTYALSEITVYSDQLIEKRFALEFVEMVLLQGSTKQITEVVRQMKDHVTAMAIHEVGFSTVIAVIYKCENELGGLIDELQEDITQLATNYYGLCVIKAILLWAPNARDRFVDLVSENGASLMVNDAGIALVQHILELSMHGDYERARKKIWSIVLKSVPSLLQNSDSLIVVELLLEASPLKDREHLIDEILDTQIGEGDDARPAVVALLYEPQFVFFVEELVRFSNEYQLHVINKQVQRFADEVRSTVQESESLSRKINLKKTEKEVKKRLLAVQFALDDEDEEEEGVVADVAPTVDEARVREGLADISVEKVYKSVTTVIKAADDDDEDEEELLLLYPNLDVNVVGSRDEVILDHATSSNTIRADGDQWIMYESDTQDYMQPEWSEMQTFLDAMDSNRYHRLMNLKEDETGKISWEKGAICLVNIDESWLLAEIIKISKDRQNVMLTVSNDPAPIVRSTDEIRPVLQAPSQEVLRETSGTEENLTLGFGGRGPRQNRRKFF